MANVQTLQTVDHEEIKQWVEDRGGTPAMASTTEGGELRIDFGESGDLVEISWDDFFQAFDKSDLAFVYQEETPEGEASFFYKFTRRLANEMDEEGY